LEENTRCTPSFPFHFTMIIQEIVWNVKRVCPVKDLRIHEKDTEIQQTCPICMV